MDDLVRWFGAQLDEDEREVRDQLCVNCGTRTAPLRSDVGITGYTHEGDWQGRRCPGLLTGAEPVQRPERMLREIEAKRRLVDEVLAYEAKIDGEWGCCHGADEIAACLCPEIQPKDITALREIATVYQDRPGYRNEWRTS